MAATVVRSWMRSLSFQRRIGRSTWGPELLVQQRAAGSWSIEAAACTTAVGSWYQPRGLGEMPSERGSPASRLLQRPTTEPK